MTAPPQGPNPARVLRRRTVIRGTVRHGFETPFLASGHLKAAGYRGEVRRLLKRRGLATDAVEVTPRKEIDVGGTARRATHFHRFRSRGREAQPDTGGAFAGNHAAGTD